MKPKLSVIIPCFNSEKTVVAAVDSVLRQNLTVPFEIIMVDDGSHDKTSKILRDLAKKDSRIKAFFHAENRGGGATRNTAVKNSNGDYIFCLDSDDILGENMLPPMINLLKTKKLDGVGIHISKKFIGNNQNRIAYTTTMGYLGKDIPFVSLFENSTCALYSTFLHTKRAFDICGGYPTSHGFDTQAFAFRFLANGLKARVCPNTMYFHRVSHSRSYYLREYESGKAPENWMRIYEEFLFLFSDSLKQKLLGTGYPFKKSPQQLLDDCSDKFSPRYLKWLKPGIKIRYKRMLVTKKVSKYDYYWLGAEAQNEGKHANAIQYWIKAIEAGMVSERLINRMWLSLASLSNLKPSDLNKMIINNSLNFPRLLELSLIRTTNDFARLARRII